jgi:hypothetical protein
MKHYYLCMLGMVIGLLGLQKSSLAQLNGYSRTALTGQSYMPISSGTTVNNSGQLSPGQTRNSDDGTVLVTLPFSFNYGGNNFSEVTFCTNGWIAFGNQTTVTTSQSHTYSNFFTASAPNNTIAVWYKDGNANFPPSGIGAMVHGLVATDIYAFEWRNANGNGYGLTTQNTINFMVKLYGPASSSPGRIEMLYGTQSGSFNGNAAIGIEDAIGGPGHYINAINGQSNSSTTSVSWPGNGNGYRFDAPSPCTGTPAGGNAISSAAAVCPNTSFTLDVSQASTGSGQTYQWQSSPDNINWTSITGQTNPIFINQGITTSTWFRRIISCGSNSSTSSAVFVEVKSNLTCYCSPASGTSLHTVSGTPFIENVLIEGTTLNNTNPGAPGNGYTQFPIAGSTTASVQKAASYLLTTNLNGKGDVSVWIDWNMNGTYEATEWQRVMTSASSGSVTITVPANAPTGNTGMRIRSRSSGHTNNATSACLQFGGGETEEYIISIIPAQPCSGTPNPGTASGPSASCVNTSFNLKTTGYTVGSGVTFQWQVSPAGQNNWTNIPGATNPISSTIQSDVSDYRVAVSCNNSAPVYSNTITVAMQTANCPTVNDEPCSAVTLPVNPDGNCMNGVAGTTFGATTSAVAGYSNPIGCSYNSSPKDVWYKVTTNVSGPGSTSLHFKLSKTSASTLKSANIMLFSVNATCPSIRLSPVPNVCTEVNSGFTWSSLTTIANNLTPNTIYYLRIAPSSSFDPTGDFDICAFIPPQPCSGTPVGGTTTTGSSSNSVCANKPFVLSVQNGTMATGTTFQWQRSTDGSNWTNLSGQTAASYSNAAGISTATFYRRVIRCGSDSSFSTALQVRINDNISCYCSPSTGTSLHSTSASPFIQNVAISGTTLNNSHSGGGNNGYTQFAATGNTTAELQIGGTYTVSTTFSALSISSVWIDWNRNGNFEPSEWKQIATNAASGTAMITVPSTASAGATAMRIRSRNTGSANGSQDACTMFSGGETEDYIITVIPAQPCTGTPAAAVVSGPANECAGKNFTLNANGYSVGAGITYQWQASPAGQNNWTDIPGATKVSLVTSQLSATDYRMVTSCNNTSSAASNSASVGMNTTNCPPINDEPCNAISITVSADSNCANKLTGTTALATHTKGYGYPDRVGCGYASTPKDVWYKVSTTASGPGSTSIYFKLAKTAGSTMTSATMTLFSMNGVCPTATLTYVNNMCRNSSYGFTPYILAASNLTPNTTYYLRINPTVDYDPTGEFEICAYIPPPTPVCVTYTTPTSNAVVPVNQSIALQWTASSGATSYDLYFGTNNPPVFKKNLTTTTDSVRLTNYNTKYYWYVVAKNAGGSASGCKVDSFRTASAGANCVPLTTSGCNIGDAIKLFTLSGASGTSINQPSGCSPNAYADYTSTSTVTLNRGAAYSGSFWASDYKDYVSIWIDFDDNGFFTAGERVLSNLKVAGTASPTPFTINIPLTALPGTHIMRVRNVYYATTPTSATDPCNNYTWGETEDYRVNIPAVSPPANRLISAAMQNTCMPVGLLTIDQNSNNVDRFVSIIDEEGKIVAAINANGNDLGTTDVTVYKHGGPVRTSANNIKVLDRNIAITTELQPTSPVTVRLYFTDAELMALKNANPSIVDRSSLNVTRTDEACESGGSLPTNGTLVLQSGNGSEGSDHYIEIEVQSFSNFYIHGGFTAVPVVIASFQGERRGQVHKLRWSTNSEVNNTGFYIERSTDASTFESLTFVPTKAVNGNSSSVMEYDFNDLSPLTGNNYYRLRQVDQNGRITYSSTVLLKAPKPNAITVYNVYPNPAKSNLNISIAAPEAANISLAVFDLTGRMVGEQRVSVLAGNNVVPLNVSALASGTYLIKIICANGCEGATTKFMKE